MRTIPMKSDSLRWIRLERSNLPVRKSTAPAVEKGRMAKAGLRLHRGSRPKLKRVN